MDYALVIAASLIVATLTFFTGFGVGTLLMPVFAIFFPVEVAVGATAVVHLLNNLFKLTLVARDADWSVVKRFAVPAAILAFAGAWTLTLIAGIHPFAMYSLGGHEFVVTPVKLLIAVLIAGFAVLDLVPRLQRIELDPRYLPLGGALSGFFGGLSGHQGALRAAFLTKLGLSRDAFIGTNVVSAVVVDVVRIAVYATAAILAGGIAGLPAAQDRRVLGLVAAGSAAAFVGSFFGSRLVRKITVDALRVVIGIMLILMALALGSGLI